MKISWCSVAIIAALTLSGCTRVPEAANTTTTTASTLIENSAPKVTEYVAKVCDNGYIIVAGGERQFATGNERWPIAAGANEDEICEKSKPDDS